MDPYLETPRRWPNLHASLIPAIRDALMPQVAPAYFVDIEQHTYVIEIEGEVLSGIPDAIVIGDPVETDGGGGLAVATATRVTPAVRTVAVPTYERVREGYLRIRDARTREVVTAIEVLSPTNKAPGEGRRKYEVKRRRVLETLTNLVEIDLLRAWQPMQFHPPAETAYRILVVAGWERPRARLLAFGIRDPVPEVTVPLRQGEAEATLALGPLLAGVYDRARFDLVLDYRRPPPEPPLSPEDATWVETLLRERAAQS
jgi:hypothetical protein